MAVRMCDNKDLVAGKAFSGIGHGKLMGLFASQPTFGNIQRIVTDNIVMRLDLIEFAVLVITVI